MAEDRQLSGQYGFRKLPLSDSFMFGEVMRNPDISTMFLEELLGEPIDHIKFISKEEDISDEIKYHGIRLDVFIKGSTKMYNVEMFGRRYKAYRQLLKRTRYYQSLMDRRSLEAGKDYRELPESYIIFVCDFDYFDTGLAVCKRKTVIEGREDVVYDDGSNVYFLNSRYSISNAPPAILEYLDFIRKNDVETKYESKLMKAVSKAVKQVRNNPEKEASYVVLQAILTDERLIGVEEGLKKGREEGLKKGREEDKLNMIRNLMKSMNFSAEQAMKALLIPESDFPKYLRLIKED